MLGLAQRAGKLISGSELVLAGLKNRQVKAVILASDAHQDTLDKISKSAYNCKIEVINAFSSEEISHAVGKKRKVLGLTDSGFYHALVKKINEGA